jgi:hypothetical protein
MHIPIKKLVHSVFGKINYGGLKHNSLYFGLILPSGGWQSLIAMEQRTLKNVNYCWNTELSFYLETSGGQNFNLYLNVVHFLTPALIRHLWQLKTVVFLQRCLI